MNTSIDVPRVRREHRGLADAHRLIHDHSCSVLSLDIFDTVLWRRVPRPTDLFAILGQRLRADGTVPAWLDPASFRQARILAEQRARAHRADFGHEVSLRDIWEQIPERLLTRERGHYVQAEVAVERQFTVPDLDIAELVHAAHDNDLPIVLVSDTYFHAHHLEHLLDRPGLEPLKAARVFRSAEYGHCKTDGLWGAVVDALAVHPSQILHVGDNHAPDVAAPRERGIRTIHYERIGPEYRAILARESQPDEPFGACAPGLDLDRGDFGITSLRAKLLGGARLDEVRPDVATAWRYGATVLGPVLAGFAEWAARRAHEEGADVVWCPMREGELLAGLIDRAAAANGWGVTAKPVWLSRHLTSIAALGRLDHHEIRDFIGRRHGMTVGGLLDVFGLHPGDVPALAGRVGAVLDDRALCAEVASALLESSYLRGRMGDAVGRTRDRLVRHLQSLGALDRPRMILADLGWGGTIQLQLARSLELAGVDVVPGGLYLATHDGSANVVLAGLPIEGFLGSCGEGDCGEPAAAIGVITRSPEVLEQSVSSVCGSQIGFDADGVPVLGPETGSPAQLTSRRAIQSAITAFQEEWLRYAASGSASGEWPSIADGAPQLLRILASALQVPTSDEASLFGGWHHDDNFGSDVVTGLAADRLRPAVPYLSPGDVREFAVRDAFWPQLVAAADPALSAAVSAVSRETLPDVAFEPAQPIGRTTLRHRAAGAPWHEGPSTPLRINRNGLSFAQLTVEGGEIADVALAIPGRRAIVRIDWVEALVVAGAHRRPEPLRWETPDDFAALVHAECTWLGGNLVQFHGPHSALWLPLAQRAGAPVSSARISVAFAVLPLPETGAAPRLPQPAVLKRLAERARSEYSSGGVAAVAGGAARVIRRAGTR